MEILIVGIIYVMEFVVWWAWYKYYIKDSIPYSLFLKRIIRYYWGVLKRSTYSLKIEYIDAPEIKKLSYKFFSILFAPFIALFFLRVIHNQPILGAIFVLIAIFTPLGSSKQQAKHLVIQMKEWIIFQNNSYHKFIETIHNESYPWNKIRVVGTVRWIVLAISSVICLQSHSLFGFAIRSSCAYIIVCLITTFYIFLLRKEERSVDWRQKSADVEQKVQVEEELWIDPKLREWEEDIIAGIQKFRLRPQSISVSCVPTLGSLEGKIAMVGMISDTKVGVRISERIITDLHRVFSQEEVHSMVSFILAHEMAHVSSIDFNVQKFGLRQAAFYYICLGLLILMVILSPKVPENLQDLYSLCIIVTFALEMIFRSEKYWYFVDEMKADRKAMAICNCKVEIIEKLFCFLKQKKDSKSELSRKNKRDVHPTFEIRIKALRQNTPWGFFEYGICALRFVNVRVKQLQKKGDDTLV